MATEILRPNDAGDYTNINNQYPSSGYHWDKVDEVTQDTSATRVETLHNTTTQVKDAYGLTDTAIPSGATINSVKVYFCFITNYLKSSYAQPFLRISTTETAGTEQIDDRKWTTYNQTLARPGGGSWAVSDLNGLQVCIGLRVASGGEAGLDKALCTQVYVEVDYTALAIVEGQASGSGAGLATASSLVNVLGTSAASGAGLASSLGLLYILGQLQASGVGLASSLAILDILAQAQASGIGVASATGDAFPPFAIVEGIGAGSGVGLATAQGILDIIAQVAGSGVGFSTGTVYLIVPASVLGSGIGESSVGSYLLIPASVSASGAGLAEAVAQLTALAQALGSGVGESEANSYIIIHALASGEGVGTSLTDALLTILAEVVASGIGSAEASGIVAEIAEAIGEGEGTGWVVSEAYYGILKRWDGSAWVKEPLEVYLAGSWQAKPLKIWDGTAWKEVDATGV